MRFAVTRNHLVLVYGLATLGAFLQIAGGTWDVASHIVRTPETFFTPQHEVLYAGITVALAASGLGLLLRQKTPLNSADRPLLAGLRITAIGGGLQLVAGPFDFGWHATYGFDPHLLTPSHSLLITGIVVVGFGAALGAVRLLEAHRRVVVPSGPFATRPWLTAMVVVALAAFWMDMNGLLYLLFDAEGWAYTFHLGPGFVDAAGGPMFLAAASLLAAPGTFVLFTAKRMLPDRRTVAVIPVIVLALEATANLAFRGVYLLGQGDPAGADLLGFLPLYVAFGVPLVAFGLLRTEGRGVSLLVAGVVGPFVAYADGFYSSVLWTGAFRDVPLVLVPMVVVGIVAGLGRARFARLLSLPPAATPAGPAPA